MNTSSDVIWLVAPWYINSFAYVFFMVSIFAASSRQHLTISSLSSCSSFIRFLFTPARLLTPAANCDRGWSCKRGTFRYLCGLVTSFLFKEVISGYSSCSNSSFLNSSSDLFSLSFSCCCSSFSEFSSSCCCSISDVSVGSEQAESVFCLYHLK